MATSSNPPASRANHDLADISIALLGGLAVAFTVLFLCVMPLSKNMAGARDFVAYWATGQQLLHHANPYDRDAMFAIEHTAGLAVNGVLLMRNPPWTLVLAYPLGLLNVRAAAILWSLILIACLGLSVQLTWQMFGRPHDHIHWLGYSFAPALICLIMGQTSLFALLGLALFLRFHRTAPFAAGASLWLCTLKPHLFLPFALVLLAWIVTSKSYRILWGGVAALAASSAVVFFFDPAAWNQYLMGMRASAIDKEFIPCLNVAFRLWINPNLMWLQYLPTALGCVWALVHFWPRRRNWDWQTNGSLLMLVSILVAPYSWLPDQALAIPALLQGAYATRHRSLLVALALIVVVVDAEVFGGVKISTSYYLWTTVAWLGWYLIATASPKAIGDLAPVPQA